MDSVFIFQNSAEEMENTSYDAIVVEQWTVVDVSLWVFLTVWRRWTPGGIFCDGQFKLLSVKHYIRVEMKESVVHCWGWV